MRTEADWNANSLDQHQ